MGRISSFFKQDASVAVDRILDPYLRLLLNHRTLTWAGYVLLVVLIGVFVSTTLALILVALYVALLLYGVGATVRRRRTLR